MCTCMHGLCYKLVRCLSCLVHCGICKIGQLPVHITFQHSLWILIPLYHLWREEPFPYGMRRTFQTSQSMCGVVHPRAFWCCIEHTLWNMQAVCCYFVFETLWPIPNYVINWMSRRHADKWSHPGHYLVDPYTWPWHQMVMVMSMNDLLPPPLCNINRPSQSEIQLFKRFDHENPWSRSCVWSKVKVAFDLQNSKSRLWSKLNPLVTFVAWSLIDMFAFRFAAIGPLLVEV